MSRTNNRTPRSKDCYLSRTDNHHDNVVLKRSSKAKKLTHRDDRVKAKQDLHQRLQD